MHQEQHALFAADAGGEQGGGHLADARRKITITEGAQIVDEGRFGGARGVALDQVLRKVEARRRRCDGEGGGHGVS